MKKNTLIEVSRKAWQHYNKLLPTSIREFVISKYEQHKMRRLTRNGELLGAGLEQQVVDSHLKEILEHSKLNSGPHSNDGMRDYPITRPHLAFDYLKGLVHWLADSNYKVLAYNDLGNLVEHGKESEEFQNWIAKATKSGEKGVLLQYDVDARPDVTMALIKTHIACKVPGNVMIFREKIFDWKLKREGIIEVDKDYDLDFSVFEAFQKSGGVVGYHCNAFDRSGGNMERAIEIFHEDVTELRKHIDLKFFSMHGGHVTPDGYCNARIKIEPYLAMLGMTWVHNGHSLYFHSNWADGSASNPRYRNESNDPLDFILSTNIGQRSRLLFHPQYYNDLANKHFDFPILQDQHWVRETRAKVETGTFKGKIYWQTRWNSAVQNIDNFNTLFEAPENEQPVLINGMSRSGTTLLASIFDAHPDGAMAYESYPRYLYVPSDNGTLTAEEYIYTYQVLMNYPDNIAFQLLNRPPLRNLMRFAAVTSWTGMTTQQTGELLRTYLTKHHRITDVREALKVVAASARFKVRTQNAKFWGTKCQGNFEDYFALWPVAKLIYIMRNGLDILASQKTNGSFNPDAKSLGKNWRTQYERFLRYKNKNPELNITTVQYEHLVTHPEETMRRVCEDIGMSFHQQMIHQHEVDTTLTKNPRGQLSAERVQQPIDNKSVNSWKKILTQKDVDEFLNGCGGPKLFREHGMEWKF